MNKLMKWARERYDRVLALFVLAVLLGSLGYLAARISMIREMEEEFDQRLSSLVPRHPAAAAENVSAFAAALERVSTPFLVPQSVSTNALLFVPEKRCVCVDCRRPIPYQVAVCPFCEQPQPADEKPGEVDSDGDGMTDSWEDANRLNRFDASDAGIDNDGDGFVNLAEFRGCTDPNDAGSHPPFEDELCIEKVQANPFRLLFRSKVLLPDGQYKFGINTRSDSKTYFVKLGEEVEGFKIVAYEGKTEMQNLGGATIKVDVSVLTLKRGDRVISLTKGQGHSYEEFVVHFFFALDKSRIAVKPDEEFVLRGMRFKLISVDTAGNSVLISSLQDGKEISISRRVAVGETPP